MPGKMPRPSGAWQMPRRTRWCAGSLVMSSPSNVIDARRRPARRPEIALQGRGLAGAVRADERDDLALVDRRRLMPLSASIAP